jgi:hypothetical protein
MRSYASATLTCIAATGLALLVTGAARAADEPLTLARDGFFYVGG